MNEHPDFCMVNSQSYSGQWHVIEGILYFQLTNPILIEEGVHFDMEDHDMDIGKNDALNCWYVYGWYSGTIGEYTTPDYPDESDGE